MDDGIEQKAGGGLAVGAGDADQLQPVRGAIVKICGDGGQRFARIGHLYPRNGGGQGRRQCLFALDQSGLGFGSVWRCVGRAQGLRGNGWRRQFAHDGRRAALDGGGDEPVAIRLFAVDGDKKRTSRGLRLS